MPLDRLMLLMFVNHIAFEISVNKYMVCVNENDVDSTLYIISYKYEIYKLYIVLLIHGIGVPQLT